MIRNERIIKYTSVRADLELMPNGIITKEVSQYAAGPSDILKQDDTGWLPLNDCYYFCIETKHAVAVNRQSAIHTAKCTKTFYVILIN